MTEKVDQLDAIRRTAYFFWEQDGRPDGRAEEYWKRAEEAYQRQLAYDRWLAEGSPAGRADAHWQAAEKKLNSDG